MFQYFSIDFGDESSSGIHGSHVVNQALYVNQALRKIIYMYREKGLLMCFRLFAVANAVPILFIGIESPKVMLLGHSAGGMVARLSLLLSNHPIHCVVSSIVMLNSPNIRFESFPHLLCGLVMLYVVIFPGQLSLLICRWMFSMTKLILRGGHLILMKVLHVNVRVA